MQEDTDSEIPPFHYGSHYSSAAIVLFYLIRLEPFTGLNRHLQAGFPIPSGTPTGHASQLPMC